jgi:UDP-glucose 4-epimerase
MSSIAVYGDARGVVTEDTLPVLPVSSYGEGKRAAEEACKAAAGPKLTVAVLRPTLVYGPFGDEWTIRYITRILSGRWKHLGAAGEGKANLIYVGDLARFAAHLAVTELPYFSVYNANGSEIPTFNEYFDRLSRALGSGTLSPPSYGLPVRLQIALRRPVRSLGKYMLKNHQSLLKVVQRSMLLDDLMKRTEVDFRLRPNDHEMRLYGSSVIYSTVRAKEIGFIAGTSLEEGLAASAEWAKRAGLIG